MATIPSVTQPEDNSSQNQPAAQTTEQEQSSEKLLVCTWCSAEDIRTCLKCNRHFCSLHSSSFSPAFCQECFKKLTLVIDKFTKVHEDYNPTTDAIVRKKEECDRLRLDGPDWVWFTKWVTKLTDDELAVVYEFHYFVLKIIETENEARKIERAHRIREKSGVAKSVLSTEKTTEKKVRKTTKVVDLKSQFKKMFPLLPEAAIDAMVAAAEKGAST